MGFFYSTTQQYVAKMCPVRPVRLQLNSEGLKINFCKGIQKCNWIKERLGKDSIFMSLQNARHCVYRIVVQSMKNKNWTKNS